MTVQVASGTLTLTTGAIGTTFTVSGLPFQPQAIILCWNGRATAGQGEADHVFGMGFATGTSSRRAYSTQSDHSPTAAASDTWWRNDAIVATLTVAGAVGGLADLDAILSDGFRLIIDDVFPAGLIVGWYAIGGNDISAVAIVDFDDPAATGNQDYAVGFALDTGLDDKAVIFLGGAYAASGTVSTYSQWMFGVAAGDTIAQAVLAGSSADGQGTTVTNSYCRAGQCVASAYDDAVFERASLTAWLSTGFRLNWAEVDATIQNRHSALVIRGGRWSVGDFLTSTGTSNQAEGTPYQPVGLLFGSHGQGASTDNVAQATDERIVGVATGATARWACGMHDKDASANADIGIDFRADAFYTNQSTAATIVVEGLADLVSFDATPGFTYVMDDADPAQAFVFYLAAASAPGAGGGDLPPLLKQPAGFALPTLTCR